MTENGEFPQRGFNPVPLDGWPWSLTEYEISYVTAFGVRPHREGRVGDDAQAQSLDKEAEFLLKNLTASSSGSAAGRGEAKQRRPGMSVILLAVVSLVLIAVTAIAVT